MSVNATSHAPIAVIGFGDLASPLEPLWPSTHRALLPLAGKSLIVYLVEQLADAGIRHIRIAGSIQQFAVRRRLGNGAEWGVTVRYSDLHGEELFAECLASEGRCLYLRGDELYDADYSSLPTADALAGIAPDLAPGDPGYWLLADGELRGFSTGAASLSVSYANPIATIRDYHEANLRVARGLLPRLNVPGAALHRGAVADWQTDIAPTAAIGDDVFIGKHSRVGHLARLRYRCVLSNGVMIDNGAQLENVSILPNCFVGRELRVRNAIIGPDGLLGFDGTHIAIDNEQLLAPTRHNQEVRTGLPDRMVGGAFGA